MNPQERASLVEARLGSDSTVVVTCETARSLDMCIETAGRTHFRSVVEPSPESLDEAFAERIAASVPR